MKTRIITLFTLLIVSLTQVFGQTHALTTPVPPVPGARRIFLENFDSISTDQTKKISTDQLPAGMTSLGFNSDYNTGHPANGFYVLAKSTAGAPYGVWWGNTANHPWKPFYDHTYVHTSDYLTSALPAIGPIPGYMMVINANWTQDKTHLGPDTLFNYKITGLCPNTKLIFRVYVGNLCVGGTNNARPKIQFDVYDNGTYNTTTKHWTMGGHLASTVPLVTSGEYDPYVNETNNPIWQSKSFTFTTANQSSVFLQVTDQQSNLTGNDFVMDDIEVWLAPPVETIVSPTAYCVGDGITLNATYNPAEVAAVFGVNGEDPDVQWFYSPTPPDPFNDDITKWELLKGGVLSDASMASYQISDAQLSHGGYYRIVIGNITDNQQISGNDYDCAGIGDAFHVTVSPPQSTLYWKLTPTDQNWNNPANWMDAAGNEVAYAPSHCTDVHIPGNAPFYPSLDVATSGYHSACNDIWFHFGGQIGRPHLLDYRKAYVQYNFAKSDGHSYDSGYAGNVNTLNNVPFSATPMARGQWYALAAPLQKIASGDFCVSGYPATWQQSYKTTPQTVDQYGKLLTTTAEWFTPENTNSWDIGNQYNAIAVWAGETGSGLPYGEGPTYQKNLDGLFGIMEMPYFENSAIRQYRPLFSHSGGKSSFQYYYENLPGLDPVPASVKPFGTIDRGPEAYRFIFQGPPFTGPNGAPGDSIYTMTVPASKDIMVGNPFFSQLDFNEFASENGISSYRLYVGNNYAAYNTTSGAGLWVKGANNGQYIAPLQAFFITTPANGKLIFNADKVALADPFNNKMRAASASGSSMKPDVIYLKAESPAGNSYLTLSMQDVNDENLILLLPQGYSNVPQLYATDENGQKNSIQFEGGYVNNVPLGVLSTDSAVVTLTVQNVDNLAVESLVLWDKYLDKKVDLKTTDTYTFKNVPSVSDRFELIAGNKVITGMPVPEVAGTIRANITGNTLYVTAASGISEVSVISLEGITLSKVTGIGQNTYTQALSIPAGAYLVSVKTANGETKVVKIVNK